MTPPLKNTQNEPLLPEAMALHENGQYKKAEELYHEIILADPERSQAWFQLGLLWKEKEKFSEAVKAVTNAAKLDPNYHGLLFNFGLALVSENHIEEAITALNCLLELQPQLAEVHYSLGLIYFHQKQLSFAEQLFNKAIELKPDYSGAHKDLGRVLIELHRYPEALENFKRATSMDPQCHEAYRYIGDIYRELGKYNDAVEAYKAEQAIQPTAIEGTFDIGLTYLRQHDFLNAVEIFKYIVVKAPHITQAHYNLGLAYQKLKQYDLAIQAYTSLLSIDPDNGAAHNDLGMIYDLLGRPTEAIRHYREVCRIEPNNMVAKHILAALTGLQLPNCHPDYVISLFDQYSESFEADLVNNLKYTVPAKLRQTVVEYFKGEVQFENALDLGCGTGMCGDEFNPLSQKITGVDLSPKMVSMASNKKVYSSVSQQDIVIFLNNSTEFYDLFIAADVFIYVGALESVFEAVQKKSLPNAHFTFSVERCEGNSFWLSHSGRYMHSQNYIQQLADKHLFEIERCTPTGIRLENNAWIPGDLYILKSANFKQFHQSDSLKDLATITEFEKPYVSIN